MACEFICDGCGKRASGWANRTGEWFKPHLWYMRGDEDGTQIACSRECIDKISKTTGKTNVVIPI
jgi:hypothetical protein